MAIQFPQTDLPVGISGGEDVWDDDAAGVILRGEYFDAAPAGISVRVHWAKLQAPAAPATGKLRRWNGSAWVAATLRRWNGSAWVAATLRRWNGSAWVA